MNALIKLGLVGATGYGAARFLSRSGKPGSYNFEGRSVLITGGTRGLGLVMARMLAEEGANLTVVSRDPFEVNQAVQDLASYGAQVLAFPCDVTQKEEAEEAVARAAERYGRLDVLINNAGVIQAAPLDHMTLDDFRNAMDVHMWGPLYLMLAAIPYMRDQGGGRIVNISSIGGRVAVPHLLPYSASKFALSGLSDGMRAELARDKIVVTTVSPGLMRTGSPVNALFKGDHEREYSWFVLLDSLPVTSVDVQKAARQIIEATRRGDPDLIISVQARLAVIANALAPGLFARAMQLMALALPKPTEKPEGDRTQTGWESLSQFSTSSITEPTYQAAQENNEVPSPAPAVNLPTTPGHNGATESAH
jgi:NAD(P)-dependent dehydrogenase (short-subunit alcohol dehydrogenase family)